MRRFGTTTKDFHSGLVLSEGAALAPTSVGEPSPARSWLQLPELTQAEAQVAQRVAFLTQPGDRCVASALLMPARDAGVLKKPVPQRSLASTAMITNVRIDSGYERLLPAMFYAIGRRARIEGFTTLIAPVRDLNASDTAVLGLKATPHSAVADHQLAAQRVDLFMHRTWAAMVASGTTPDLTLLAAEVEETVQRWVANGTEWSFFKALREQRLAREQYVYTLSNLHQFVRHTTRLIGRAVGASADPELRKHWIDHLNGEVNHEVIIERDLKHMHEDVEYVTRHMAPCRTTQEFMAIQESMIAYYNDPILMMASPLAAEAVTAHLDQHFVEDLLHCAASWGIEEPKRACQFLISHMNTDGGEDGHWRMSIEMLPKLIRDEARLAQFLTINACSRRSIEGVFTAPVDDTAIWSA
jgi:hypothetical protein